MGVRIAIATAIWAVAVAAPVQAPLRTLVLLVRRIPAAPRFASQLATKKFKQTREVVKKSNPVCSDMLPQAPLLAAVGIAAYMLGALVHGVATFRSCPTEAIALHEVRAE